MSKVLKEVERELDGFCAEARTKGARAVLLFGSRAKGEHTEESDADVCIIADYLPEDLLHRRYVAPSGYHLLSVFGFHPAEFLRLLEQGNTFVLEVMHDGLILYDDGFWRKAQEMYQETIRRYKLQKAQRGWNFSVTG